MKLLQKIQDWHEELNTEDTIYNKYMSELNETLLEKKKHLDLNNI